MNPDHEAAIADLLPLLLQIDKERCPECLGDLLFHAFGWDRRGQARAWCLPPQAPFENWGLPYPAYVRAVINMARHFYDDHTECTAPLQAHTFNPSYPSCMPDLWCPEEEDAR